MKITPKKIETELLNIVQQILKESGEEYSYKHITLDASLQRHLGIDSLGRAELFQRIQRQFDIALPDNLLVEADTLKDVLEAILVASPAYKIDLSRTHHTSSPESTVNPTTANTLLDTLLLYATETPDRPHVYFQDEYGKEEIITYQHLLNQALIVAKSLQNLGLMSGETVAIMLPTHPQFFYTFMGVLLAGGIPVPIYPPLRPSQIENYTKQEAKILQNAQVRILITFHQAEILSRILRSFIPSLKTITTVDTLLNHTEKAAIFRAKADDFALIQYTSGSTSTPKGVLLAHENLLANIRNFGKAMNITAQDVFISWLPLYHDLGLIGAWLGSLYYGTQLVILSPLTFLNHPERWLWTIHYHRGTISGAPNFGYELCVRKIEHAQIEGLDLSSLRASVNGAEAIQPKTLVRFSEKFKPYGLKPEALMPVYGLAENTVGLTVSPLNRAPRIDVIKRKEFEENRLAVSASLSEKNTLEFVSCGFVIPQHAIRIVDEQNQPLAERHIGYLQFQGPSSMRGYYRNPEATNAVYHHGWWDTGDMAYLADDELFIVGRKKDMIIKAGRNLYPTEIEDLTAQIPGIRQGCVIAFGITNQTTGTEKLVIVAETKIEKNRADLANDIATKIVTTLDIAPDDIVLVPPKTIPKTSSGKLQRAACKNAYLAGELSQSRKPVWWQIVTLKLRSIALNISSYLKTFAKMIYTGYVALLVILLFPFILICLFAVNQLTFKRIFKRWSQLLCWLALCPLKIQHAQRMQHTHNYLFVANHASYLDAIVLSACLPENICFVGKQSLFKVPLLRLFLRKLAVFPLTREDPQKGMEEMKSLQTISQQGNSLVIFPEGTFSFAAGLRPFKLGAFKIAQETKMDIMPIAIAGTRTILRGNEWLLKPGRVTVTFCDAITPTGNDWQSITQLKNLARQQIAKYCGEPTLDMIAGGVVAKVINEKSERQR